MKWKKHAALVWLVVCTYGISLLQHMKQCWKKQSSTMLLVRGQLSFDCPLLHLGRTNPKEIRLCNKKLMHSSIRQPEPFGTDPSRPAAYRTLEKTLVASLPSECPVPPSLLPQPPRCLLLLQTYHFLQNQALGLLSIPMMLALLGEQS